MTNEEAAAKAIVDEPSMRLAEPLPKYVPASRVEIVQTVEFHGKKYDLVGSFSRDYTIDVETSSVAKDGAMTDVTRSTISGCNVNVAEHQGISPMNSSTEARMAKQLYSYPSTDEIASRFSELDKEMEKRFLEQNPIHAEAASKYPSFQDYLSSADYANLTAEPFTMEKGTFSISTDNPYGIELPEGKASVDVSYSISSDGSFSLDTKSFGVNDKSFLEAMEKSDALKGEFHDRYMLKNGSLINQNIDIINERFNGNVNAFLSPDLNPDLTNMRFMSTDELTSARVTTSDGLTGEIKLAWNGTVSPTVDFPQDIPRNELIELQNRFSASPEVQEKVSLMNRQYNEFREGMSQTENARTGHEAPVQEAPVQEAPVQEAAYDSKTIGDSGISTAENNIPGTKTESKTYSDIFKTDSYQIREQASLATPGEKTIDVGYLREDSAVDMTRADISIKGDSFTISAERTDMSQVINGIPDAPSIGTASDSFGGLDIRRDIAFDGKISTRYSGTFNFPEEIAGGSMEAKLEYANDILEKAIDNPVVNENLYKNSIEDMGAFFRDNPGSEELFRANRVHNPFSLDTTLGEFSYPGNIGIEGKANACLENVHIDFDPVTGKPSYTSSFRTMTSKGQVEITISNDGVHGYEYDVTRKPFATMPGDFNMGDCVNHAQAVTARTDLANVINGKALPGGFTIGGKTASAQEVAKFLEGLESKQDLNLKEFLTGIGETNPELATELNRSLDIVQPPVNLDPIPVQNSLGETGKMVLFGDGTYVAVPDRIDLANLGNMNGDEMRKALEDIANFSKDGAIQNSAKTVMEANGITFKGAEGIENVNGISEMLESNTVAKVLIAMLSLALILLLITKLMNMQNEKERSKAYIDLETENDKTQDSSDKEPVVKAEAETGHDPSPESMSADADERTANTEAAAKEVEGQESPVVEKAEDMALSPDAPAEPKKEIVNEEIEKGINNPISEHSGDNAFVQTQETPVQNAADAKEGETEEKEKVEEVGPGPEEPAHEEVKENPQPEKTADAGMERSADNKDVEEHVPAKKFDMLYIDGSFTRSDVNSMLKNAIAEGRTLSGIKIGPNTKTIPSDAFYDVDAIIKNSGNPSTIRIVEDMGGGWKIGGVKSETPFSSLEYADIFKFSGKLPDGGPYPILSGTQHAVVILQDVSKVPANFAKNADIAYVGDLNKHIKGHMLEIGQEAFALGTSKKSQYVAPEIDSNGKITEEKVDLGTIVQRDGYKYMPVTSKDYRSLEDTFKEAGEFTAYSLGSTRSMLMEKVKETIENIHANVNKAAEDLAVSRYRESEAFSRDADEWYSKTGIPMLNKVIMTTGPEMAAIAEKHPGIRSVKDIQATYNSAIRAGAELYMNTDANVKVTKELMSEYMAERTAEEKDSIKAADSRISEIRREMHDLMEQMIPENSEDINRKTEVLEKEIASLESTSPYKEYSTLKKACLESMAEAKKEYLQTPDYIEIKKAYDNEMKDYLIQVYGEKEILESYKRSENFTADVEAISKRSDESRTYQKRIDDLNMAGAHLAELQEHASNILGKDKAVLVAEYDGRNSERTSSMDGHTTVLDIDTGNLKAGALALAGRNIRLINDTAASAVAKEKFESVIHDVESGRLKDPSRIIDADGAVISKGDLIAEATRAIKDIEEGRAFVSSTGAPLGHAALMGTDLKAFVESLYVYGYDKKMAEFDKDQAWIEKREQECREKGDEAGVEKAKDDLKALETRKTEYFSREVRPLYGPETLRNTRALGSIYMEAVNRPQDMAYRDDFARKGTTTRIKENSIRNLKDGKISIAYRMRNDKKTKERAAVPLSEIIGSFKDGKNACVIGSVSKVVLFILLMMANSMAKIIATAKEGKDPYKGIPEKISDRLDAEMLAAKHICDTYNLKMAITVNDNMNEGHSFYPVGMSKEVHKQFSDLLQRYMDHPEIAKKLMDEMGLEKYRSSVVDIAAKECKDAIVKSLEASDKKVQQQKKGSHDQRRNEKRTEGEQRGNKKKASGTKHGRDSR